MTINPLSIGAIDASGFTGGDPLWSKVVCLMHFDTTVAGLFVDVKGHTTTNLSNGASNPVLDTSVYKFSPGSVKYSGGSGGGRVHVANSAGGDLNPGTQEFCIEWFMRSTSNTGQPAPLDFRVHVGGLSQGEFLFFPNGTDLRVYLKNTLRITGTAVLVNSTWQHFALDRHSGVTTLFVDGVSKGTYTDSQNYNGAIQITFLAGEAGQAGYPGNIDEFRYTIGASRYNGTNFTPPGAPFPNF